MFRKIAIPSLVILFFVTLLFTSLGHADNPQNTFYVAINGQDSNPGTLAKPWATINHAAEVLKAGQTVYIRGGTYRINQQIKTKNSGRKNNWIVYASYPGEQATIEANNIKIVPPTGNEPYFHDQGAFQIEKVSYIRIKQLKLTNAYQAGFTVRDSHHIELYNNTTNKTFSSGIAIWDTNRDGQGCDHNKVIGNTIIKANTHEMNIPGYPKEDEAPHEAISVGGAYYFEIAYNHVYNSDKEGIDVKETSRHGTVHHNYVHNVDRQGLYVDNWGDVLEDIEVYDNVVHDCKGAGLAISVENGKFAQNIRIHHNLIYDNLGTGIFFSRWGGDGHRKNIKVYNNTVHHNGHGKPDAGNTYYWITGGLYLFSSNLQDIDIRNNIFSDNQAFQVGYSDKYLTKNKDINQVFREKKINIQHNLVYDKNQIKYPVYVGWPPDNFANVYATKGSDFVEKAPLFVEPKLGNFYLQRKSPAIDQGSPEKTYTDPDGTRNDLGAFAYGSKQNLWWKNNFPPQFDLENSKK